MLMAKKKLIRNLSINTLMGEWLFSGNANDTSGNGRNGIVNGAVLTTDRNGLSNSAYLFENDNINVGTIPFSTNDFSISMWFLLESFSPTNYLMSNISGTGEGFLIIYRTDTSRLQVNLVDSNSNLEFGQGILNELSLNTWYHFVITVDRTNELMKGYLNNTNNITKTITTLTGSISSSTSLRFGNSTSDTSGFDGKLDDIRIYSKVLTTDEITALYNE